MKRYLWFLLFFCILLPLNAETHYYRSNWVGLAMEPIDLVRIDEYEYVLKTVTSHEKRVSILYHKQKEWKRWEIQFDDRGNKKEERVFENDTLVEFRTFDRKGRTRTEERYAKGAREEKLIYTYSSRGVDFVQTFDAQDNLKYTDEYALSPVGRLRSMRRIFPDGTVAVIHFTYGEGILVGAWEYRDSHIIDTKYNENGQPERKEEWDNDTLVSLKEYTYDPQTGALVKETEKHIADKIQRERFYDPDGNLVSETEGVANLPPVELTYTYKDGRRTSTRKKSEIGVELWRFYYDEEGKLKQEEYFRRGFLQMRTIYTDPDSWYEELFHDDEVIIRIYFEKERKIREEFIQDGQVVRTTTY